jgi:hypothetical protein
MTLLLPERATPTVYALVVWKDGPKVQEARLVESAAILKEHPEVGAVPGGGGMFTLRAGGSVDFMRLRSLRWRWCC